MYGTLKKYVLIALLFTVSACQCKKENVDPPAPPAPPQDTYLVTSIRINGIPKDSLVYNNQQQLIERWDYNTSFHQWQNYISFIYAADGYLKTALYYNENDNSLKSRSQKDSLAWTAGRVTIYTTYYRELGEAVSGYDTSTLQINNSRLLSLAGSKDTFYLNIGVFGEKVEYEEYLYQQQDISHFTGLNYINIRGGQLVKDAYSYDMRYNSQINPLFRYLAKNPILLRKVTADLQDIVRRGYPFLASEHYVTSIRSAAADMPVTYYTPDTLKYPLEQILPSSNKISYRYKIIKAP
ncbi:hypothetical protein [Chitinophaga flava]|uniref:DUF4595 domain-containing protein n=1 Tax=Chitinophaga flava TaxID=2259036 RepID=A0A365XQT3_9BACT|nr:hypothetical protein [Chitinophaga flava]RBL88713.1 hypothetical protein DF182_19290 [Chitinophaga flava]